MGCDIHFHVEKFENGKWVAADNWHVDPDNPERSTLYKWGEGFEILEGPMYRDRNYSLFAMLANVRNGYGFAGVDTGDALVPIFEERGMPKDASPEVQRSCDDWGVDGHSHTWMTVGELMEYDWTQIETKRGYVSMKEFARFVLDGRPHMWCGATTAPKISLAEAYGKLEKLKSGEKFSWRDFHAMEDEKFSAREVVQIQWEVPYYEQASKFLSETMPKLWQIGRPDDVRCVIWFDN